MSSRIRLRLVSRTFVLFAAGARGAIFALPAAGVRADAGADDVEDRTPKRTMKPNPSILPALFLAVLAASGCGAAAAGGAPAGPERAAFVTRLGNDTIAVERLQFAGDELRAEVLLRVPRTTLHVYRLQMDGRGNAVRLETTAYDPAAGVGSAPLSRQVTHFGADRLVLETSSGATSDTVVVEDGPAVLPFIDMVHWPFELVLRRAYAAGVDSVAAPLLTGRRTQPFVVRRVGAAEYTITHPFRGTTRTRVGDAGRLVALDAAGTTRALTVARVDEVDLPSLAQRYAALDAEGRSFGSLSGRGEAAGSIDGARLTLDYGRPARRGREIFGALVPWDRVWRTGADRATHLTTDRDLVVGGTPVPAGSYTLFTIPRAGEWTLIVNRRTDITGTAHDPAHDLARIPMRTRTLPEVVEDFTIVVDGEGRALRLRWDTTEAYVPIEVPAR
jgi:hypothetical protein